MIIWLKNALIFSLVVFIIATFIGGNNVIENVVIALIIGFPLSLLSDFISKKIRNK